MSAEEELRQAMRRFNRQPQQSRVCLVTAVDEDAETVDVEPLDGSAPIYDVRLNSVIVRGQPGLTLMPEVNSHVMVTLIGNNESQAYLSLASKFRWIRIRQNDETEILIDKEGTISIKGKTIKFNGDGNGGIGLTEIIAKRLNRLEDWMESLVKTFNEHTHTVGAPATLPPIVPSAVIVAGKTSQKDISSKTVKHG